MLISNEERMQSAMQFFDERASLTKRADERRMYEHLREIAAVNQLNSRLLDVFQKELEEFRHELGTH